MSELKYKEGDRVRIKSLDWYNENKSKSHGTVACGGKYFDYDMREWCGKIMTVLTAYQTCYIMQEDGAKDLWTDEMIEGLVEEPLYKATVDKNGNMTGEFVKLKEENQKSELVPYFEEGTNKILYYKNKDTLECYFPMRTPEYICPEGYQFKDENGNVINAQKIVLEKVNTLKRQSNNMETETHRGYYTTEPETTNKSKKVAWFTFWDNDFADKVELDLSNRELIQEDGKWFVVKKKKEYPKTYEECCEVLNYKPDFYDADKLLIYGYMSDKLRSFQKLLVCRDAYWKLYGEEMGLGEPWKPEGENTFGIFYDRLTDEIEKQNGYHGANSTLELPTEEMRDAFKKNFDPDIEICKELL